VAVASRGPAASAADRLITLGEVQALIAAAGGAITGEVKALAGASVPTGWLLADGSAVSRTTYAALYTAIGTAHGTGDGSTTFNLPDLRGRAIAGVLTNDANFGTLGQKSGESAHTLSVAEMPSHSHGLTDPGHNHSQNSHGHGVSDGGHNHNYNHGHGLTDNTHNHGASSGNSGNHTHAPSSGTGFLIYNGTSVTRGHVASGTTSTNYLFQTPTQSDLIFGGTSNPGDHNHSVSIASSYANVGVNGTGDIYTSSVGANIGIQGTTATNISNTTGIAMATAGTGTAHNVVQPTIALTVIIKT
jgi:microcystin-dependent protein